MNLSHSSVHVPTDVFDGAEAVINAIDWSRKLEDTFQVCSRFPSCVTNKHTNKQIDIKKKTKEKNMSSMPLTGAGNWRTPFRYAADFPPAVFFIFVNLIFLMKHKLTNTNTKS